MQLQLIQKIVSDKFKKKAGEGSKEKLFLHFQIKSLQLGWG